MKNGKHIKLKGDVALTQRPMNNTVDQVGMLSPTAPPTKSVKNSAKRGASLFVGKKDDKTPRQARPSAPGASTQLSSNFASAVQRTDFTQSLGGKISSPGPGSYMPEEEPKKHALSAFPSEKRQIDAYAFRNEKSPFKNSTHLNSPAPG
jgi:hypothetical protein